MNKEIKEILKKIDKDIKKVESFRHPNDVEDRKFKELGLFFEEKYWNIFKYTLDYITNLEQENNNLREENLYMEVLESSIEDYKLRIDKVMKLINKTMLESDITGNGKLNLNELLNILNGGDEE